LPPESTRRQSPAEGYAGRVDPLDPPSSSFKTRTGLRRIAAATLCSINGLRAAWRHEAAFRQEVVAGILLVPIALWLAPGALQAAAMIGVIALVWIVELLNSAIETVADSVSLEWHPLIGRAKDIGSAAVMISLLLAAGVWAVILWPVLVGTG
jgi:diacylglycerol kinase (ATP)